MAFLRDTDGRALSPAVRHYDELVVGDIITPEPEGEFADYWGRRVEDVSTVRPGVVAVRLSGSAGIVAPVFRTIPVLTREA